MQRKVDPSSIMNIVVAGKSGAGKQPRIEVLCKKFNLEQLSTGNIFREYVERFNQIGYTRSLERFWDENSGTFIPDEEIRVELERIVGELTDYKAVILGLKAKYFVERGLFVPDHLTNQIFKAYFSRSNYRGKVLDGYPRTLNQAEFLLTLIGKNRSRIDFILLVDNDDETIVKRAVGRRICPKCGKVFHIDYKPPLQGRFCDVCNIEVIQRSDDTEERIRSRLDEFAKKTLPAIKFLEYKGIPLVRVTGDLPVFTEEAVYESVMNEVRKLY